MQKIIIYAGLATLIFVIGLFVIQQNFDPSSPPNEVDLSISSYEECIAAGYPALESYPEQCRTPDGKHFVRKLSEEELQEMIEPVVVRGQMVCLPHWDTSGPHTLECAYGLLDDAGNYYVISFSNLPHQVVVSVPMNTDVEVKGTLIPGSDSKYQSIGRIEVEEINEL